MNGTRTIGRNLAAVYASQFGSRILAFLWLIGVARYLGTEGYGKLMTAVALTSLLGILVDFGLAGLIIREVARSRGKALSYLRKAFFLKGLLSVVMVLLAIGAAWTLGYPEDTTRTVYLLAFFVILQNFASIPRNIYFAYECMVPAAIFLFLAKTAAVGIGFLFLFSDLGLYWIAGAMSIEGIVELLLGTVFLRRFVPLAPPEPASESLLEIARKALPLAMAALIGLLYFSIDTVMLSRMKGDEIVGWYNAAFRLMAALAFLPGTLMNTLYPTLSRRRGDPTALHQVFDPAFRILFLGALFIALLFLSAPERIIQTLYTAEYLPAVSVLRLLGLCVVPLFCNVLLGGTLVAVDREKSRFKTALGGAIVNVAANLLLIPRWAEMGAAAATLLTQSAVSIAYGVVLLRTVGTFTSPAFLARSTAAAGLTYLVVRSAAPFGLPVAIAVGSVSFACSCVLIQVIGNEDRELFARLIREWRGIPPADVGT